jgi:hypothetical protein
MQSERTTERLKENRRCDRNRNRSKRRAILCPLDQSPLDSVSPKYALYADKAEQLQQRGLSRKRAFSLMANQTTVRLDGEWLEAFWCPLCQQRNWFHVRKLNSSTYSLSFAPGSLWQQVSGVIYPHGNPSVGEYSRRQARSVTFDGLKDFQRIG